MAWAATARRRVLGELCGWELSFVARVLTGESIDPRKLNPYAPPVPVPEKSPERRARENRAGWRILETALFGRVVRED